VEPERHSLAVLSHMYPMHGREAYGMFVSEQVRALVAEARISVVIAPVPAVLWPLRHLSSSWRRYASAERTRTDFGSVWVTLPRYLSFPRKALTRLSAWSAYRSIVADHATIDALRAADVLVAHTALLDGRIAQLLHGRLDLPYAVVIHGADLYQNIRGREGRRLTASVGRVLADAAAVIAVSDPVANGIAEAFPDLAPPVVLPNGVDTSLFAPSAQCSDGDAMPSTLRILSAGNLVERKAHAYVLQALAEVAARGWDVRYTIAGDGSERPALEALAVHLGLADCTQFTGAYSHGELPALLRANDLFVLPSWDEAFGVVYLESMACGVPVVAAYDGGAAGIVDQGVDGLLVPARDVPSLVDAIMAFASMDSLERRRMQEAAREKALHYTWTRNAKTLVTVLRTAVTNQGWHDTHR